MQEHILIVEDDPAIQDMLSIAFSMTHFKIYQAEDVRAAQLIMADHRPDIILLDWMMPEVSGIEFARRLKKSQETQDIPILMLTARGEEDDRLRGFDVGVDDYITKPFSPKELMARISAVLRRVKGYSQLQTIESGQLKILPDEHRVFVGDSELNIGPTEYKLLHFFMTNIERVFSRAQLLDRVWGGSVYIEERTIDVHIRRLRKILAESGYDYMVQTVRGVGYRFSAQGS
ncbi:MAG: phosphate regulon transcriptional regulator PhoB [Methylococcales bacterium]|mgnify:CR=1 FL=1|nr:phosphate regulon transcriptional regulator PhoB [Methylococcales bacterium]MBT7445574.1 phosphate regulon transcriptional regulator PhoB [Methylococcales bacterium]